MKGWYVTITEKYEDGFEVKETNHRTARFPHVAVSGALAYSHRNSDLLRKAHGAVVSIVATVEGGD